MNQVKAESKKTVFSRDAIECGLPKKLDLRPPQLKTGLFETSDVEQRSSDGSH